MSARLSTSSAYTAMISYKVCISAWLAVFPPLHCVQTTDLSNGLLKLNTCTVEDLTQQLKWHQIQSSVSISHTLLMICICKVFTKCSNLALSSCSLCKRPRPTLHTPTIPHVICNTVTTVCMSNCLSVCKEIVQSPFHVHWSRLHFARFICNRNRKIRLHTWIDSSLITMLAGHGTFNNSDSIFFCCEWEMCVTYKKGKL